MRAAVTHFAQSVGVSDDQLMDVTTAVSEAVANVISHAYPDRLGEVHVTATVTSGELRLRVEDDGVGCNAPAAHPGLGLGLGLIAGVCSSFTLEERRSGGTLVTMAFSLDESR